jgi:hypothetical protein
LLTWDYGHLTADGARFASNITGLNDEKLWEKR